MASKNIKPIGEPSGTNWHRFGLDEVDSLVSIFEISSDEETKEMLVDRMQELFIESAPAIPLFADPTWGVYSTKRFKNFPTEKNPYAQQYNHRKPRNKNTHIPTRLLRRHYNNPNTFLPKRFDEVWIFWRCSCLKTITVHVLTTYVITTNHYFCNLTLLNLIHKVTKNNF